MRQFIKRALSRLEKLSSEQFRDILLSSSREITRLETVIDSLPRGILVCDTSHKLLLANRAGRRFLSIGSFEQARDYVWNIISDEKIQEFLSHTFLATDRAEEREFYVNLGGKDRLLSLSVMPLVEEQKIQGSLILIDDITDRRAREALMRRMENLASLTTLAAGVAHEVKNPLGSISIYVQLIQKAIEVQRLHCPQFENEPNFHSQVDRYLNIVNEEIERLNAIVVDFLFAVRPINIEPGRTDLNSLIRDLAEFVSYELKEANIECDLNLDENLPILEIDEKLIKQAVLNLIQNASSAIKEKNDGKGRILLSTCFNESDAEVSISDNGSGISDENLSKIFEPYFTTKDSGTGLGLTVTFKIVKEHMGDISVKSTKGEGSIFTVTLPLPKNRGKLISYREYTE